MQSYDEARELVMAATGMEIRAAEWERFVGRAEEAWNSYLDRRKWAENQQDKDEAVFELAKAYEYFHLGNRRPRSGATTTVEPNASTDLRWPALMEILRLRADRDPDVESFRSEVLDGRLVAWDDLTDWMRETAARDGKATGWVTIPLHDDGSPWTLEDARRAMVGRESTEVISFVAPDSPLVLGRPIRLGGTLWRLRRVARRLFEGFAWSEAWVVTYIVTGETPERPQLFHAGVHLEWTPATSWIEMKVNPLGVEPGDLATVYGELKASVTGKQRVRPIENERTARLAVFWDQMELEGVPVGERRGRWNRMVGKEHPDWRYMDARSNFGRDARNAHRLVVGESE